MLGCINSVNPMFRAAISDKDIDNFEHAKQHFSDCYLMTTLETLSHTPNGRKVLKEQSPAMNAITKNTNQYSGQSK